MSWFDDVLLNACSIWLSPDWVTDRSRFDARVWARGLREAGFESLIWLLKHHDGLLFFAAKEGPRTERDFTAEIFEECRQVGLRVIAYYSAAIDDLAVRQHPDWKCVDVQGNGIRFHSYPDFFYNCINSPYGEYALGHIAEAVERYRPDGIWLDILRYPPEGCYCEWCVETYERQCGGDLRAISRAEHDRFNAVTLRTFAEKTITLAKAANPEAVVTFNGAGAWLHPEYHRTSQLVDFFSREGHTTPIESAVAKAMRGRGKPFEVLTSGCIRGNWSRWALKPPNLLKLEGAVIAAHGGTVTVGINPFPNGEFPRAELQNLQGFGQWLQARRPFFRGQASVADVAIWELPYQVNRLLPYRGPGEVMQGLEIGPEVSWRHPHTGYERALVESHIPFDILVDEEADLSRYRLIITSGPLSETAATRLREYVHRGGTLLCDAATGLADETGERRGNFLLADVLGIDFLRQSPYGVGYAAFTDPALAEHLPDYPLLIANRPLLVRPTTAEVLAKLVHPVAERTEWKQTCSRYNAPGPTTSAPMITVNRYGKGRAYYVAGALGKHIVDMGQDDPWSKHCVQNLVRVALGDLLLETDAPAGVEIVLNRQASRYLVHVLNHYVGHREHFSWQEDGPQVVPFKLGLNEARLGRLGRVICQPEGRELPTRRDGQWLWVEVPALAIHHTLTVEGDEAKQ